MLTFSRKGICITFISMLCQHQLLSQVKTVSDLDQKYLNWHQRDPLKSDALGTSVDRVYEELIQNSAPKKTIIVAVIDSGVDIDHEDLSGMIWVNEKEIPGNHIDDDQNGYVDDIHGWNFIGNKNGDNISFENFEYTRLYKAGDGPHYERAKKLYEKELEKQLDEQQNIARFEKVYYKAKATIKEKTGITVNSLTDLDMVTSNYNDEVMAAKRFLSSRYEKGFNDKILASIKENNLDYLEKFLNKNFNARSIIGDDPTTMSDVSYGNPNVKGPRSDHGTSVAGVIASIRNNGIGINGIAMGVKIMCLRSTPRGDERDKDVALAIKYAVNNGASIINLSFGKAISPQKHFVDEAVKLAEAKNVLIVHASGNSSLNIDKEENYPSDEYLDESRPANWITVGASAFSKDEVATKFTNYGKRHVSLFAPGENIISSDSSSTYSMNNGTSLSAPVVSGIAALVLSYYPTLSAQQLISILMESSYKVDKKVMLPSGSNEETRKIKFGSLSSTGGIVNAFEAMKKAGAITSN
jgi:subtilisin family serine protease